MTLCHLHCTIPNLYNNHIRIVKSTQLNFRDRQKGYRLLNFIKPILQIFLSSISSDRFIPYNIHISIQNTQTQPEIQLSSFLIA